MARKKKADGHAGGHGWYVTFADLMALLMAFFVVVAASSTQDKEKMATALGSIREAFGVQTERNLNGGVMELEGVPVGGFLKNVGRVDPRLSTQTPGPDSRQLESGELRTGRDFSFSSAATTLRQAMQDVPEIAEISRNILVHDTRDGLAIQLMDQDGRSMFADGAVEPYERVRAALARLAPVLSSLPQRLVITGHTAQTQVPLGPGVGPWEISADRANAVRRILAGNGVPMDRFESIAGRADTEPLYPDNPFLPANRRITITLTNEPPPLPADAAL